MRPAVDLGLFIFVCVTVFHTSHCKFPRFILSDFKKDATSFLGAHGLKFVDRMRMGENNDQRNPEEKPQVVTSPHFCHGLDCPSYTPEKGGEGYEAREYIKTSWVSTSLAGVDLEQADREMFMKLFYYIEGKNEKKEVIKMTAPVLVELIPGQGPACKNNFTMSFFLSPKITDPPKPTDTSVFFTSQPKQKVYVSSFPGFANEKKWIECAEELSKALIRDGKKFIKDYYLTAGYDSPYRVVDRHNEVWYIAED